jgi:alkanesulfonate monooxygenase SsuD/methylene tetrahydromethanopterin reductase-like flavin-dependent oxidoreductase (luciferase family)
MGGAPLELGLGPWTVREGSGPDGGFIRQAELAEELGYHSIWLPENHFDPGGSCPSPLLLLAAAAARTSRLRIGTTSYLLPVRHPVQVAEDVAVLDRLSGGRVVFGIGRGFRPALFRTFGVPASEKRDRFEAALRTLLGAWRGEPVAWSDDGSEDRDPWRDGSGSRTWRHRWSRCPGSRRTMPATAPPSPRSWTRMRSRFR